MVAVTYAQAHRLLRVERGRAANHPCSRECGRRAAQWAYVGPRRASERRPWSFDLSLYEAMCLRCHSEYDRAAVKALTKHPADSALF